MSRDETIMWIEIVWTDDLQAATDNRQSFILQMSLHPTDCVAPPL